MTHPVFLILTRFTNKVTITWKVVTYPLLSLQTSSMSNARSERGACEMHFSITLLHNQQLHLTNNCSQLQSLTFSKQVTNL